MRNNAFLLASAACIALMAHPAWAEHQTPLPTMTTHFYGQVGKALVFVDDGTVRKASVLDFDRASTRFGFTAEHPVNSRLTASFLLEGELVSDATIEDFNTQSDNASASPGSFTDRHTRLGFAGDFGAFFIGHTSSATDEVTEKDLSNSAGIMGSDIYSIAGGALFRDGNGLVAHGQSFGDTFANLEGFDPLGDDDRVNLVRYDSPIFNGFSASAAIANGGDFDAALQYEGHVAGLEVLAGLGFVSFNSHDATLDDVVSGSVSVKHASGLNLAVAAGEGNLKGAGDDPTFWYAKLGYDVGSWGFGVDYGTSDNGGTGIAAAQNEADSWGLGALYDFGQGVTAGLTYRNLDAEDGVGAANQRDSVDLVAATLVIKF